MLGLLCVAVASPPATFSSDAALAAQAIARMPRGAFRLTTDMRDGDKRKRAIYELRFVKPNQVVLRTIEPVQNGLDRIDRTYAIDGRTMVGYDWTSRESIRRQVPLVGNLSDRLMTVLGAVPEAVAFFLNPEAAGTFFAPLRKVNRWQVKTAGGIRSWSVRTAGTNTSSLISFRLADGLPHEIRIYSPGRLMDWRIERLKDTGAKFALPKQAISTSSFMQRLAPPTFLDAGARNLVQRAQRTYDALRDAQITIDDQGGRTEVWMSGGRFLQRRAKLTWAFDGQTLTVIDHGRRRALRIKATRLSVIEKVTGFGGEVHAFTRYWLLRENPMRQLLTPDFRIRSAGSMRLGGASMSILRADGVLWTGSLLLRSSNGLLEELNVKNLDRNGRVVGSSRQVLTYKAIGTPIPASRFQLAIPKGYAVVTR